MTDVDFVPTADFKPVIPLPPLVEFNLEDENENVIFNHLAKLYQFDSESKEWIERGRGNIKILQAKEHLHRVRVVMWRDKVLKLATNHWITGGMKIDYYQGNKKVLTWMALDFTYGEPKPEIFTCRFGTEEKCAEFKAKIEEMIALVSSPLETTPSTTIPETLVSPKEKAKQLQLPENFFDNESETDHANDCPGCRGCDDESFIFSETTHKEPDTILLDELKKAFRNMKCSQEPEEETWEKGQVKAGDDIEKSLEPVEEDNELPKEWEPFDISYVKMEPVDISF